MNDLRIQLPWRQSRRSTLNIGDHWYRSHGGRSCDAFGTTPPFTLSGMRHEVFRCWTRNLGSALVSAYVPGSCCRTAAPSAQACAGVSARGDRRERRSAGGVDVPHCDDPRSRRSSLHAPSTITDEHQPSGGNLQRRCSSVVSATPDLSQAHHHLRRFGGQKKNGFAVAAIEIVTEPPGESDVVVFFDSVRPARLRVAFMRSRPPYRLRHDCDAAA